MHVSTDKICVTGMGLLTPFGYGISPFLDALQHERCAIRNISDTHPEISHILSTAAYFPSTRFLDHIKQLTIDEELQRKFIQLAARAPQTVQASLLVALQAYQQAKLLNTVGTERTGIIIAGNNTTQALTFTQHQHYVHDPGQVSPRYALNFFDSSHLGYVSELLGIKGEGHVVGAASASGNMAIIQAVRLLELGCLDHCLVIGVYADFSGIELQALRQIGALGGIKFKNQPLHAARPFDQDHEGFIPGQAACCLLLERNNTAIQRQIPILGYILGYGISLDAQHSSEASVVGEILAMRKALLAAQVSVDQIDYINAHGTSSILGDEVEAEAIATLFSPQTTALINSTKSVVGHCIFSSGIVEAIATLLQINGGFLHSNLNLNHPIKELAWVRKQQTGNYQIALSNNFAFGGINTSIIFHKGELSWQ